MIDGLGTNLSKGTAKTTFGEQTDASLAELTDEERNDALDHFHNAYLRSFAKLSKHIDNSAAMDVYEKCRVFDPRQAPSLSNDIKSYSSLRGLSEPSESLQQ